FERLELNIKQILAADANKLITQPGISAQLIVTLLEGSVSRYIRSKFKEAPSSYSENIWTLAVLATFKD
ncbi:nucleoid occlusion factor SlmA, partial [Gammaproteobacteria bacterium]|nr:nucleoid occlusion factor SlmA [Gammaproteobacteria bacterium]